MAVEIILHIKLEKFLLNLEPAIASRTYKTIDLLEKYSIQAGMPHVKYLEKNLYELRTAGKQHIRIFFCFNLKKIILLHGIIKKTSKTPLKELSTARKRRDSLQ
jgi:phage-related protein